MTSVTRMLALGFLLLALRLWATTAIRPDFGPLRINCGGEYFMDNDGTQWSKDSHYLGGEGLTVANASTLGLSRLKATLRSFPAGQISCYSVSAPSGEYLLRLGFVYDAINGVVPAGLNSTVRVFVEGVLLSSFTLRQYQDGLDEGMFYREYVVEETDGEISICLSSSVGPAFISTLEVFPQDDEAYDRSLRRRGAFFSKHVRLSSGGNKFGPPDDSAYRVWLPDTSALEATYEGLSTDRAIEGVNLPPEHLPAQLFQTARSTGNANYTGYSWSFKGISPANMWLVRLYFSEIDEHVRVGDRVFDVEVNSVFFKDFDIMKAAGGKSFKAAVLTAYVNLTFSSYSNPSNLMVGLSCNNSSSYKPILSGVEIHEVVPAGSTREIVEAELKHIHGGTSHASISNADPDEGLPSGTLVGIIVAGVGMALVAGFLSLFAMMWRRQRRDQEAHAGNSFSASVEAPATVDFTQRRARAEGLDAGSWGDGPVNLASVGSGALQARLDRSNSRRFLLQDSAETSAAGSSRPRLEGIPV